MIGALACRYLGTTPARLLGTLLAVALTGKGPQRACEHGTQGQACLALAPNIKQFLCFFLSLQYRPGPNRTVPGAQLYFVHTACIHPCSGPSRLEAQMDGHVAFARDQPEVVGRPPSNSPCSSAASSTSERASNQPID